MSLKSLKGIPYNEYSPGLGYSPGSGPPVGSTANRMSTYFEYPTRELLPNAAYNKPNKWFFGKSIYARNTLSNVPKPGYPKMRVFPNIGGLPNEVGPGTQPGGMGGPNALYPFVPSVYWLGFGRKTNKRRSRKGKRRSRKGKRRSRKGKRKMSIKKKK